MVKRWRILGLRIRNSGVERKGGTAVEPSKLYRSHAPGGERTEIERPHRGEAPFDAPSPLLFSNLAVAPPPFLRRRDDSNFSYFFPFRSSIVFPSSLLILLSILWVKQRSRIFSSSSSSFRKSERSKSTDIKDLSLVENFSSTRGTETRKRKKSFVVNKDRLIFFLFTWISNNFI